MTRAAPLSWLLVVCAGLAARDLPALIRQETLYFERGHAELSPAGVRKLEAWVASWSPAGSWVIGVPEDPEVSESVRAGRITTLTKLLQAKGISHPLVRRLPAQTASRFEAMVVGLEPSTGAEANAPAGAPGNPEPGRPAQAVSAAPIAAARTSPARTPLPAVPPALHSAAPAPAPVPVAPTPARETSAGAAPPAASAEPALQHPLARRMAEPLDPATAIPLLVEAEAALQAGRGPGQPTDLPAFTAAVNAFRGRLQAALQADLAATPQEGGPQPPVLPVATTFTERHKHMLRLQQTGSLDDPRAGAVSGLRFRASLEQFPDSLLTERKALAARLQAFARRAAAFKAAKAWMERQEKDEHNLWATRLGLCDASTGLGVSLRLALRGGNNLREGTMAAYQNTLQEHAANLIRYVDAVIDEAQWKEIQRGWKGFLRNTMIDLTPDNIAAVEGLNENGILFAHQHYRQLLAGKTQELPAEVQALLERISACSHWGGEGPLDADRARQMKAALEAAGSRTLKADVARMKVKYQANRWALQAIRAAE